MRSGEGIAEYCYEDIDVGEELRDQKGVLWEAGGGGLFVSGKVSGQWIIFFILLYQKTGEERTRKKERVMDVKG